MLLAANAHKAERAYAIAAKLVTAIVPRLVSGQRIGDAHVRRLVANRDAGAFLLDPVDPSERRVRVVKG